jgi:glycosyltransferase involved in cell wall biosynthesis
VRILVVNKFWYHRGGLERVMFDEIEWLENAGHEVAHFSTAHPLNEPSPWSQYFAPYLEIGQSNNLAISDKLLALSRMFYNHEAARAFKRLLVAFRPDVVHVHGIHRQISGSILIAARDAGAPVVQTMHDFHAFCPADILLRGDGKVCDPPLCRLSHTGPAIRNRCVDGGILRTLISTSELAFRTVTHRHSSLLTAIISPSRFLASSLRRAGLIRTPIFLVPNAVRGPKWSSRAVGPFLYAGRLCLEKGLPVLLEAAEQAQVPLAVAGDGPLRHLGKARHSPLVQWLGFRTTDEVQILFRDSSGLVLPSLCIENAPMSVLEAMASGVPVVASSVGGVNELLRHTKEGLLVSPGSVSELREALLRLAGDPSARLRMGLGGRDRAANCFSPERHLRRLMTVYDLVAPKAGRSLSR